MRSADKLFANFELLREKAASRGTLRVSALPLLTQAWLMPRIARFAALHPEIDVAISSEHKVADLQKGEADIAIRNLRSKPSGLVARKLMDVRGVPVCAPSLKSGRTPLNVPEDLARHTLIQYSSRTDAWDTWFAAHGLSGIRAHATLTVDTVPAALEAAARGAGIALGTDPIMWDADVAKGLVPALNVKPVSASAYYVCTTKQRARDPQVLAFTDWLFREAALRGKKSQAIPA